MATPRTPQRSRLAPDSPATPSVRSPSPNRPRPAVPRVQRSAASASPQVKAALAALRKNRQTSATATPSLNSSTPDSASRAPDPFSTPPRANTSEAPVSTSNLRETSPVGDADVKGELGWAKKNEDRLIEAAKKTGLLNFASQGLEKLPRTVYASLLPRSSPYHPSRRHRSMYRQEPEPTYSFTRDESETAWFEQCDLKSLNLANNELKAVDEEIGGFEDLEFLDLHGNLLPSIPPSFGFLVHLTSLNLASNAIHRFPTQIVNLRFLRDLDLSHNQLENLWTSNWEAELAEILQPPETSPSATPESPERIRDFFADSPFKRSQPELSTSSACPFPLLRTLNLSGSAFDASTFTSDGFELPPRLKTLDLSSCQLVDSSLPPLLFGRLRDLVELDLANNGLSEDIFTSDVDPLESSDRLFPALRTLELSLNPVDNLENLEEFLTRHVSRPIEYVGLPKVVMNLVKSEEQRLRGGKRIGLPLASEANSEAESVGFELEIRVRECMLRGEQERRRAKFPTRDRAGSTVAPPQATALEVPSTMTQSTSISPSSSPPRSKPLTPPTCKSPSQCPQVPSTPSRKEVVLEPWEIEAAAGLSTPAGRRKAAAQAARERAERLKLEEKEKQRIKEERERAKEVEAERNRVKEAANRAQEAVEITQGMETVALDDLPEEGRDDTSQSESSSPPPYSPRESQISRDVKAPRPSTSLSFAAASDPALVSVTSAFNPTSHTVNLTARSLVSLPTLTTGSPPPSAPDPTALDLSRNSLTWLPLVSIDSWNWSATLRTLTITHNRITSLLDPRGGGVSHSSLSLPSLTTLDLSHNHLTSSTSTSSAMSSSPPEPPLLSLIHRLFPALRSLSLSYNRLTSLEGIESLLLGEDIDGDEEEAAAAVVPPRGGGGRLKTLTLNGNKISDVQALCRVAERIQEAERRGRPVSLSSSSSWTLEELDLSDNEIARLPPTLGLLPHSLIFAVSGNTFRFPRREVWDRPGARLLLPNLRERLA